MTRVHALEDIRYTALLGMYPPTRMIAIHTPTLTGDCQYSMTIPDAVTSDAINIENEYLHRAFISMTNSDLDRRVITSSCILVVFESALGLLKIFKVSSHTNSKSKTRFRKPSNQIWHRNTLNGKIGGHFSKHVHDKVYNT